MSKFPIQGASDFLRVQAARFHEEADRVQTDAQDKQQEVEGLWKDVERLRALAVDFKASSDRLANEAKG